MRLKDLLNEGQAQLDPYYQASLNGAITFPTMDQYYELYRFSVLTASADAKGGFAVDATHVLRDHPMTVGYSKEEQQMLHDTAKMLGKEVQPLTDHGSNEPKDTHTASPVATRRELWDLWGKSVSSETAPKVNQPESTENRAYDADRISHLSSNRLAEGWKERAGAVAAAACIAGTPGCATTGSNDLIPTLNAIDRISRITKPGMRELGAQELKDIARGDRNNSAVLRMLKKAEEDAKVETQLPVKPTPKRPTYYAIYTNGVPATKYLDRKEAEEIVAQLQQKFPEYKFEIRLTEENYGKYWCSTDKKWKQRQSPKQSRGA